MSSDIDSAMADVCCRAARAGVSLAELWCKCVEFGLADVGLFELDAYLHGALRASPLVAMTCSHAVWELEEFPEDRRALDQQDPD